MKVIGSHQWFPNKNKTGDNSIESVIDPYKHPFVSERLTCPTCLYPLSVHGMITEDLRSGFENGTVHYDRHTLRGVVCPGDTINKLESGRYKILKPSHATCMHQNKQVEMM